MKKAEQQQIVDDRALRLSAYSSMVGADVDRDSVYATLDNIFGAMQDSTIGKNLVQLDSILSKDSRDGASVVIGSVTDMIMRANTLGTVTADAIDTALIQMDAIASSSLTQLDGVQSVEGSEIIGMLSAINAYSIIASPINNIIGNIGDAQAINGTDSSKVQVLSLIPVVTKAMGDLADGVELNSVNAMDNMAFSVREEKQTSATATLIYTFNLKKISTDGANYAMNKGTNELNIGNLYVTDENVNSGDATHTASRTDGNSIVHTAVFNYSAGTIVLTLSADIANGSDIYFKGELDHKLAGEISGSVGSEISEKKYTANFVVLETEVNAIDLRQTLKTTGVNLMANGLGVAYNKISLEETGRALSEIRKMAVVFGAEIDLTTSTGKASTMEEYKQFMILVEQARAKMVTESQITSELAIIGGTGIINVLGNSANNTDGKTIITSGSENSFRLIGYTNNKIPVYFDPKHDTAYPIAGGVNTAIIVGVPADPTKRVVLRSPSLPIIPVDLKIDANSVQKVSLQGKIALCANKEERPRKLVKKITYKI